MSKQLLDKIHEEQRRYRENLENLNIEVNKINNNEGRSRRGHRREIYIIILVSKFKK
eukprot:UN30131